MPEYEFVDVYVPRGVSRKEATRLLTDHAEYGHWELDRLSLRRDGSRKVRLRRLEQVHERRSDADVREMTAAWRGDRTTFTLGAVTLTLIDERADRFGEHFWRVDLPAPITGGCIGRRSVGVRASTDFLVM